MKSNHPEIVEKRSDCPLSRTLDLIGDKWSLLIIRDMLFFGKNTYNAFLDSAEKISTNILNDPISAQLEGHGDVMFYLVARLLESPFGDLTFARVICSFRYSFAPRKCFDPYIPKASRIGFKSLPMGVRVYFFLLSGPL